MTTARLFLVAALALYCASCAATNVGGGERGAPDSRVSRHVGVGAATPSPAAAPTDSLWLRFTAPRHGALSCDAPDTTRPLRDAVRVIVLRLKGQPPFYRPGCEFNAACWDSVRAYGEPDTLWQAWAVPGAACSLRVARGAQYVPRVRGQACGAWKVLVVQ